jgi:hypothetical protein
MYPDRQPDALPPEDFAVVSTRTLLRLADGAEYVSQRLAQMEAEVRQAEQTAQQLQGLSRQLRSLASNTALEATRMQLGGPLAEIARQMRRLSQRMSEANEHLAETLRVHAVATGDLREAGEALLRDARSARPPEDRAMALGGQGLLPARAAEAGAPATATATASGAAGRRGRAEPLEQQP